MTTAAKLAEIANAAEAEILAAMPAEMRAWYQALPRETRVEMARAAFTETAKELAA